MTSSPRSSCGPSLKARCAGCQIRARAVCAPCSAEEIAWLEQIKYYRTVKAGQPIAWAEGEMDFVASVMKGMATVSQTSADGRKQMVGLLLPSDFIGRPGRASTPYDVTAASEVMLCCFHRRPFEQFLTSAPKVSERLLAMSFDELDAAREWMMILGRRNARERVASLLAIVARRQAKASAISAEGPILVDLPLTRAAMADYLGTTLFTVSRIMNEFKVEGIVELNGRHRIVVPDLRRLISETGDDMDGGLPA